MLCKNWAADHNSDVRIARHAPNVCDFGCQCIQMVPTAYRQTDNIKKFPLSQLRKVALDEGAASGKRPGGGATSPPPHYNKRL